MTDTYNIVEGGKAIQCLKCNMTSWNPNDVVHRYCGNCKAFHEDASIELGMMRQHLAKIALMHSQIQALLEYCPDAECAACGEIMCPHGDPLHYHHDGCPSCAQWAEHTQQREKKDE